MTTQSCLAETMAGPAPWSAEDRATREMFDEWLAELTAARDADSSIDDVPLDKLEALAFLNWLEPLVAKARRRFRLAIDTIVQRRVEWFGSVEAFEAAWLPLLARRLSALVERTCALELNIARLEDRLAGDTPRLRLASFLRRLRRPEAALAMIQEYGILARRIVVCLTQWHNAGVELAERLANDGDRLGERFFPGKPPAPLAEIDGDAGDQHRDGRSVLILRFGSDARLVYKPRPLAVDAAFAQLVEWLNARGASAALRPLSVLDCGEYGWAEFVLATPCGSPEEVHRFYTRQGMYLALFNVLGAADMHYENLIADGEHPVFVDLEALFYRRLPESTREPAQKALIESVLGMRLLPHTQAEGGGGGSLDISGLGAASKPLAYDVVERNALGTDAMGLATRRRALPEGKHRPRLLDRAVSPAKFQAAVLTGFCDMHDLLRRKRRALVEAEGPLAAFPGCQVRFLPRPTQVYAILNSQAVHPAHLHADAEQAQIHQRLWAKADKFPSLRRLIAAERADLARGDIPLFTTRPDSRDVWTSRGERIEAFFPHRAFDAVCDRLQTLDADDLARQQWLIRASFALLAEEPARLVERLRVPDCQALADECDALLRDGDDTGHDDCWSPPLDQRAERFASLLAHARRLKQLAWQNGRDAGWISLSRGTSGWELAAVGLSGVSGLRNIAGFLLKMEMLTGDRSFGGLARKAQRNLRRRLREEQSSPVPPKAP